MKKLILLIVAALSVAGVRADVIARADSAYLADDFLTAAALYDEAIDSLGPSADRYYNLGNAYYRAGLPGMAIVSYERALRLDPNNKDIIENLEFVNSKTVDRIEQNSGLIGGATDRIASKLHPDTWALIAMVSFILAMVGIGVYFFASAVALRKVGFFGAGILVVVCVVTNMLAVRSARRAAATDAAIITAPSVILSTTPRAPKDRSEEALLLHEGTKVFLLDSIAGPDNTWYDVRIDNEHRAWISSEAIEII